MPIPVRPSSSGRMAIVPAAVAKGLGTALIAGIAGSLLTGVLFYFIPVTESVGNAVLIAINTLAALMGGIGSAKAAQTHGWLNGGLTGLLFATTLWLVQAVGLVPVEGMTAMGILVPLAMGLVVGGMGGMFGIAFND